MPPVVTDKKSGARVTLRRGVKHGDAKSVVQLLALGAGPRDGHGQHRTDVSNGGRHVCSAGTHL